MNILENIVLLSADGVIIGGDESSIGVSSSNSGASAETGTSTGTSDNSAASGETASTGSIYPTLLIYGALIVAMYFLLFRPQRKQAKEMKELQTNLKTGDSIVTSSGMFGKIVGIGQDCFLVEFGENRGVRIWVRKNDIIANSTPVTTPLPTESGEDKAKK